MSEQVTQICDNCSKAFPQSKMATHFGYCRRNIKKCPTCGQMYDTNFQEDHQQQFHKMAACKFCKKSIKPHQVINHEDSCAARTNFCQYCQLDVPVKNYSLHLKQCQSRTKQCEKCRKTVANRDFLIHTIQCPGFVQQQKPQLPSSNSYNQYNQFIRQAQKRQDLIRNEYKPQKQEPKREYITRANKQADKRTESVYTKIIQSNPITNPTYSKRQQVRPSNQTRNLVNRDVGMINRQPINKQPNRNTNFGDINKQSNKYVGIQQYGQKKPTTNIVQRQRQRSHKGVDFNKNIGLNPAKHTPSTRANQGVFNPSVSTNLSQPSSNKYPRDSRNEEKPIAIQGINQKLSSANGYNYSDKRVIQGPTTNNPKGNQNYKKQIPRDKNVPMRIQTSKNGKQTNQPIRQLNYNNKQYNEYLPSDRFKKQQVRRQRHEQLRRNVSDQQYLPTYEQQYVPQQQPRNSYFQPYQEDEQLQKAIEASMQNMGKMNINPTTNQYIHSKPHQKIEDITPDMLQNDLLNESFYGKQMAIMEEIQKKKKRR